MSTVSDRLKSRAVVETLLGANTMSKMGSDKADVMSVSALGVKWMGFWARRCPEVLPA